MKGATCPTDPLNPWVPVSIHAPREGRDKRGLVTGRAKSRFQSTRPVKGATDAGVVRGGAGDVSIHAPREGRDWQTIWGSKQALKFQSTRPVKGATDIEASDAAQLAGFNPRAP